jgi:hypothetical protein
MASSFEAARAACLDALSAYAQGDERIEALWLQGSLARGGADSFSDNAYLAIRVSGVGSSFTWERIHRVRQAPASLVP